MTSHNKTEARELRSQTRSQHDPKEMLDVLLALDRMLVESQCVSTKSRVASGLPCGHKIAVCTTRCDNICRGF